MATVQIKGMSCQHCAQAVTKALEAIPGISKVQVSLDKGEAVWEESAPVSKDSVKQAIEGIGFELA